eukprot:scaffold29883_cov48-Attheya_sp.AAC.2
MIVFMSSQATLVASLMILLASQSIKSTKAFSISSIHTHEAFVVRSVSICEKRQEHPWILHASMDPNDGKTNGIRDAVKKLAQKTMNKVSPKPAAIAAVIKDATFGAAQLAADEAVMLYTSKRGSNAMETIENVALMQGEAARSLDAIALAKTTAADAFDAAERAMDAASQQLDKARAELKEAKEEARAAISSAEAAAVQAAISASVATALAAASVSDETNILTPTTTSTKTVSVEEEQGVLSLEEVESMEYHDVDYHLSEMAPPFIGEDQCLVPGEAVVRVEKAPENSRRIFAGIDIMASIDDVWNVLTNYEHLQDVVPNLVVNEVLESLPEEVQADKISKKLKGCKLRQVGGAKVVGINFSARTTLEVREWPQGMPDFCHFTDDSFDGISREARAKESKRIQLKRYRFPRPFALSRLPTKDISMQSIANDDGEFRMYQGVWRMQPLPGCAPPGKQAMRLTYAVEISPRAYLPVSLVEGRITQDMCTNLRAIRDFVNPELLGSK